jgi:hypothetical protein
LTAYNDEDRRENGNGRRRPDAEGRAERWVKFTVMILIIGVGINTILLGAIAWRLWTR